MLRGRLFFVGLAAFILPMLNASVALADDRGESAGGKPAAGLSLELNSLQPSGKGCRLTFVISNHLAGDLEKAAFEIALFDRTGMVERMSVLDFQDLPKGKTKVSRFDIPGADCTRISRILVNTATQCSGSGLDASDCIRKLDARSRTQVNFGS